MIDLIRRIVLPERPFKGTQFLDYDGEPLSGGMIYIYHQETTYLVNTYQDYEQNSFHPNPIILDSEGAVEAFLDKNVKGFLKIEIFDRMGIKMMSFENVEAPDDCKLF